MKVAYSYLEVIDDEDRALEGVQNAPFDQARISYEEARKHDVPEAVTEAERLFRTSLFRRLHARQRTALCFSGSGIRSATFGLGVLQGLAVCSARTEGSRPQLLGEFDYLSTVSGGGYLGAWFSAWATRSARPNHRNLSSRVLPDECDGPAHVIRELSRAPEATFDPEPAPVRHLRAYTNYLAPRIGLFSADTWALASTVIRNALLNWLVLVPLLAAVTLVPVIELQLLRARSAPAETLWFLIATAFLLGVVGTAYVGYDLPSAGNKRNSSKWFICLSLLPLSISAIQLGMFWAWLPNGGSIRSLWDIVSLGKQGLRWWQFGLFGSLMYAGGIFIGTGYMRIRYHRPARITAIVATAGAALTGFLGGLLGFMLTHFALKLPVGSRLYAVLNFPAIMIVFMLAGTLLVGATSYVTADNDREWWARANGWFMAVTLGWATLAFLALYAMATINWLDAGISSSFAALTAAAGWGASHLASNPVSLSDRRDDGIPIQLALKNPQLLGEYGARLLLLVFLTLLTILLCAANNRLMIILNRLPDIVPSLWPALLRPIGDKAAHALWLSLGYVLTCLIASWFINVNKFSLHGLYRQRLIRAYLGASSIKREPHPFTGFDENDNFPMCALTRYKPLHVINMTLNLVNGSNVAWQQRKAESFTSTRLHSGSCRVGYRDSDSYGGFSKDNSARTPITLGTAMTISGAAESPNRGYHSSPLLSLVMTLFNARLGWWLGNPRKSASIWTRPGPRWGIKGLLDDALGLTNDESPWLYLSDGGHFENLGIYEMVLRRCSLIVVSDAGADPDYIYEDLANAIRKVRIDMGIAIEFDPQTMPMAPTNQLGGQFGGKHCAIGRILYGAVDEGAQPGTLIYIKASLNHNEPADVNNYAATNKTFPHESGTAQFSESQFESYRRLGLHIIEEICGSTPGVVPQLDLDSFAKQVELYAAQGPAAPGIG